MFRQKQNCRSDSILISVDKKVYIVYRKAFGNTESLFYVLVKLHSYYIKKLGEDARYSIRTQK